MSHCCRKSCWNYNLLRESDHVCARHSAAKQANSSLFIWHASSRIQFAQISIISAIKTLSGINLDVRQKPKPRRVVLSLHTRTHICTCCLIFHGTRSVGFQSAAFEVSCISPRAVRRHARWTQRTILRYSPGPVQNTINRNVAHCSARVNVCVRECWYRSETHIQSEQATAKLATPPNPVWQ